MLRDIHVSDRGTGKCHVTRGAFLADEFPNARQTVSAVAGLHRMRRAKI